MHWERYNVNPMLALRNAICNDRWREMWQKALGQHRKLQALQRSVRAEQRAQAFLAGGNATSAESLSQSAPTVSESLLPAAPCQPARLAEAPSPILEVSQPSSCRLSSRRKQHTARNRVKYSPQKSGEVSREMCVCGAPLVQSTGSGRTK